MRHFAEIAASASVSLRGETCVEYVPGQPLANGQVYENAKMYDEINSRMQSFRRGLVKKLTLSEQETGNIILNS